MDQGIYRQGTRNFKAPKHGAKPKSEIDESNLTEVERLKLELEKEKALRKRIEVELGVIKKRNFKKSFNFESKTRSRIQDSRFL